MPSLKQVDQIALLEACLKFTECGIFLSLFTYPQCGWDLVRQGLVTEDRKITIAGRALLFHLDKCPDPTTTKTCIEFTIPIANFTIDEDD